MTDLGPDADSTANHLGDDLLGRAAASVARDVVVAAEVAPACVATIAARTAAGWVRGTGWAGTATARGAEAVTCASPFDLASVTKPYLAATVARLVASGHVEWGTPLGELLAEARETSCADASLESLLAHRAGLDAHRPLYEPLARGEPLDRSDALRVAADARRTDCLGPAPDDGFPPVYSDLGYLLAGQAIARVAGRDLGELIEAEVCVPLALSTASARRWRLRDPGFDRRVVATEHVGWRGGEIRGEVHDENAWALARDGVAGHAGLFDVAESVARFGTSFLDALAGRSDWLSTSEARVLVRCRPGGTLRAGFDGKAAEGASAGHRFGPNTFGHLGFTGTSLWCDPDAEVVVALLTNRVCPTRDHVAIRAARPVAHDVAFEAAIRRRDAG